MWKLFYWEKARTKFPEYAYAGGLVKSVLVTVNDSTEKQRIFVHQAIDQMQENYGISEEWANYIMNSVASSWESTLSPEFWNSKRLEAENGDSMPSFL